MSLHDLGTVDRLSVPESAAAWLDGLPGAVVVRVRGRDASRWRAVVGMLHGNEPSGLHAVHRALSSGLTPATNVLFVVGAVEAARRPPRHTYRMLPGRRDLNRCFLPPFDDEDGRLAHEILKAIQEVRPEAVVDVHNNSGHNPPYGVAREPDPAELGISSLFADRFVVSRFGLGTLSDALEGMAPVVTAECGRAGDPAADEVGARGVAQFIAAEQLPVGVPERGLTVLGAPIRVKVAPGLSLAFGDHRISGAALTFDEDVDRHNFQTLPTGSHVGWIAPDAPWPVVAMDQQGHERSHELFERQGNALLTRRELVPIMMTTNSQIALDDCLFYAVESLP